AIRQASPFCQSHLQITKVWTLLCIGIKASLFLTVATHLRVIIRDQILYHPVQKMRFSILAAIVALTASVSVSACSQPMQPCTTRLDCCS
ncbi:uncharacterized protein EDB93DRAFT_1175458, partial [Suillus bovinus]|uniref:uncharacterized protein n=1 Tax=Suillus bovinus TaxID=48563 RepID=UPI001B863625